MKKNVMFSILCEVLEIPSRYEYLPFKSLLWYSYSELVQFQREYNRELMYELLNHNNSDTPSSKSI